MIMRYRSLKHFNLTSAYVKTFSTGSIDYIFVKRILIKLHIKILDTDKTTTLQSLTATLIA